MDENAVSDFLKCFDDKYYPEDFLKKYEILECLANNQMGETLLVKDRFDTYYISKCYTDSALMSRTTESGLLKKLKHNGLPEFKEEFQNENMLCVVREFADGIPLSQLKKPLTEKEAVSAAVQLCEILSYLHGQTPPIIHRDIKPQNIVIDDDGKITLIDFGISRTYDENAGSDTVFFGTQEFAPPEQYGFSQTDNRADIYSLGVVLGWLLTGKTKGLRIKYRRLEYIVKKCTAFAPNSRYKDAKSVKRALENSDGHKQKTALKICCGAVALLAVLTAGFALGRFTDIRPALFYGKTNAYFKEPLIEQAVRLQLGKADGEAITAEELEDVTELYIYAGYTVKTQQEFNELRSKIDRGELSVGNERISSLHDFVYLKNLTNLSLGYHDFRDISDIAGLKSLESLELFRCRAGDISAISSLPRLRHLTLQHCTEVTDLSPLADCPRLSELILADCYSDDYSVLSSLGKMEYLHLVAFDSEECLQYLDGRNVRQLKIALSSLSSLSELDGIKGLEDLYIDGMQLESLSGIESLSDLKKVTITDMTDLDLSPLVALSGLKTVTLSENMREAAKALESTEFEIIYQ